MIFNLADAEIVIAELEAEDEWKQKQIVSQRKRIAELEEQLDKIKRMEFICCRCGIRKDGESEGGDF